MEESKQLEALKQFDTMNQKYNSYTILGYKIIGILFGIFTMLLAFIPVQEFVINDIRIIMISFQFFLMMHFMYYNYWQVIGIERHQLLLYQLLKELPINPSVICRDRAKKMLLFNSKITAVFIAIQVFSSLVFLQQLTIWNIVVPLLYSICAYIISYLLVKISGMC